MEIKIPTESAQQDKQAQADTINVENLVKKVSRGAVRVPVFQRPLRWEAKDVVDLFDSIYRGYPIGSLLLNKLRAPAQKIIIGKLSVEAPENPSAFWVIDGQQRITALTVALSRPTPIPTTPEDEWVVYFDAKNRTFKSPSKDGQIPSGWVPVAELLDASTLSEWVYNWEEKGNPELRAAVFEAGARIRQYEIPLYTVETNDEQFLRDIFHRINNYGKNLKWSEIHDAIFGHKGKFPSTLSELADELVHAGMGKPEKEQLPSWLLAFKGLDVTRSLVEHIRRDENVLENAVQEALPAIRRMLNFLDAHAEIPHLRLLPRSTPLPVLIRFFALHQDSKQRTLTLLARWTWRVLFGKGLFEERTLLRRAISAIGKDEEGSVQALLGLVSNQAPANFVLPSQFDARSADSRIALVGLAALKPRDFYDGTIIDMARLIEDYEIRAFRRIVTTAGSLVRSPANRILSQGLGVARREIAEIRESLWLRNTDEVLRSHAISPAALAALKDDRAEDFLKERKDTLEKVIDEFGKRLAAWGQSDRPSLEYIMRPAVENEE